MAKAKIINKFGTMLGWNNMSLNLFGRELEGFDSLKYSDKENHGLVFGGGKYAVGKSKGNYEPEASISLYIEENIALLRSLPKGMRLQEIPDFDIPVSYEYQGSIYTDIIRNCSFTSNGRETKNGEGKMVMEYPLCCTHIDYNV